VNSTPAKRAKELVDSGMSHRDVAKVLSVNHSTVTRDIAAVQNAWFPIKDKAVFATPSGDTIRNIGVVCVVFKLRKSVTPNFWVNVFDPTMAIPGFVEFSRLRPTGDTIVFVPYYMPTSSARWAQRNDELIDEAFGYLKRINPSLTDSDRIDAAAGRLSHAQPVCPPGFGATIPKVQTPIAGLQVADTCFYYPEDRGISEGVRWAKLMAEAIEDPSIWDRNH
jgi:protoporphyrinogen oxidase